MAVMMRLDKFLCEMGVGTRSEVKNYLKKGQITLNGEIVKKPEVKIDAEGFWTVNGERVVGANGNPVLADDISNTLFKNIEYNEQTGYVEFTLVDGSVFSVRMYEALNIEFDAPAMIAVPDPSAGPITLIWFNYTINFIYICS